MRIVFHSNQISERGTETAIIDYAFANQQYLENESIIAFPSNKIFNEERFLYIKENFKVIEYTKIDEFHDILEREKVDLLYAIVDGESYPDLIDSLPLKRKYKTFVHAVFSTKRYHGDFYCPIHSFLNEFYHSNYPVLPHIVVPFKGTSETLRDELQIPQTAIVFGSYGGPNSFNIPFVQECVREVAIKNKNIYFIFLNVVPFADKDIKNIIFLPGTTNLNYKEKFINTTDAMLHARSDGETFGLGIGEFSIKNKPVITYSPPIKFRLKEVVRSYLGRRPIYSMAHIQNLKDKAICYHNQKELYKILVNYSPIKGNFDCFSEKFSPETVIKTFNNILSGRG